MRLRIRGAGWALIILGAVSVCAHANLLINGDFQTGDLTAWTAYATAYPGGTGTSGICSGGAACPIAILFDTTGSGASYAAEFNVGVATGPTGTDLFQGAGLYQDVVLSPGTFVASLDWAVDSAVNNADGGSFAILLNGTELNAYDTGVVSPGSIIRGTLSASTTITTSGTYQLEVEVTRNFMPATGVMQFVDNVTVSDAGVSDGGVPEPATWALAVAGVAVLGHRRARKPPPRTLAR